MSRSLTPFDKQNFKESKWRRRQARIEDETGRILPRPNVRRKVIIIICAVVFVVAVCGGIVFFNSVTTRQKTEKFAAVQQQESETLLTVVNKENPLPSDYVPELKEIGSFKVRSDVYKPLTELINKGKSSGINIKLTAAYISYDEQNELYHNKLNELLSDKSYTNVRAEAQAQKLVPKAGCSEAQTGLLVSFNTDDSKVKNFIEMNCIEYGFVLRYPSDKEDITKLSENNYLYRYVGKDNAVKMRTYGMCLEEYNDYLLQQKNNK